MPVLLSRRDAQLAAAGCRALAYTLRSDAEHQSNAKVHEQTLLSASRLERLAQLFDDHALAAPVQEQVPPADFSGSAPEANQLPEPRARSRSGH